MMIAGLGSVMPVRALVLVLLAAAGLGGCVPDVVPLEAVPTTKFSRDLALCQAEFGDSWHIGNEIKRCMQARGHRFLREY
jgi:hypothetical protein